MKRVFILWTLILGFLLPQKGLSQRTVFQKTGIAFSVFEKPRKYDNLYITDYESWFNDNSGQSGEELVFANVRNNLSVSAYHSWTHMFNRLGFEFGVNLDFIFTDNSYRLSFIESFHYDGEENEDIAQTGSFQLPRRRSTALTLGVPLYYVHKFTLSEDLTLFARAGPKVRFLLGGGETQEFGEYYTDGSRVTYEIGYKTSFEEYSKGYGQIVTRLMFDWQYGVSIDQKLENGNSVGIDFSINTQVFSSSFLISEISNIVYENDQDEIEDFRSTNYFTSHYFDEDENLVVRENRDLSPHYAEHKLNGLSIGVFYRFGNRKPRN